MGKHILVMYWVEQLVHVCVGCGVCVGGGCAFVCGVWGVWGVGCVHVGCVGCVHVGCIQ